MTAIFSYVKKHTTFFLAIGFLVIFSVTVSYATPPGSPYPAGQTLDPQCAPGSTNCTVAIGGASSQWTTTGNDIYYNTGNVGIGTTSPDSMLSIFNAGTPARYLTVGQNDNARYLEVGDHTIQMGDIDGGSGALLTLDHPNHVLSLDRGAIAVNGDGSMTVGVTYNNTAGHALMEVNGGDAFQAGYYIHKNGAEIAQIAVLGNSNDLSFSMAGTERMRITAAGNVGIGTTNPGALLDLEGDGSIIAVGAAGAGISVPSLGAGERMMWIPNKAAFRAGSVNGTQWDSSNVGFASTAFGEGNIASGDDSFAAGQFSTASGNISFALGNGSTASGFTSIALGRAATAAGTYSFAVNSGYASGLDSFAINAGLATGDFSTSLTPSSTADAYSLVTVGRFNIGGGDASNWVATDPAFEVGIGTQLNNRANALTVLKNGKVGINTAAAPRATLDVARDGSIIASGSEGSGQTMPSLGAGTRLVWFPRNSSFRVGTVSANQWDSSNVGEASYGFGTDVIASGSSATAFGVSTGATGTISFAAGYGALASGNYATAIGFLSSSTGTASVANGYFSSATADYAFVGGFGNSASGISSTAFGSGNTALGDFSFITGQNNHANGTGSFAAGVSNTADGVTATAFGSNINATAYDSFALGRFNVGGGDAANWVGTDPLFEVGNGSDSINHSDAFIILKNGKTGIALDPASPMPTYTLQVGSSLVIGAVARFQNSTGTCDINPTTASLVCSSDMNLKTNIANLSDNSPWNFNTNISTENQSVLAKVLALSPVAYNWKTEAQGVAKHPGFIAQDVQQVFPDLVATDPTTNLLSLNYTGLIPYTIEAIKEMDLNVTNIANLDRPNTWREALIGWLGSTTNGITNIFSKQVTTPTLCVGTNDDNTCITKDQLDHLLQNQNSTTVYGGGSPAPVDTTSSDTQSPATDPVEVAPPATDAPAAGVPTPSTDQTQ